MNCMCGLGMHREVQLIMSGGIRNGADVAKALALGRIRGLDRTRRADRAGRQRPRTRRRIPRTLARACGKSHVHNLEPEDLVALTIEAAAMAQVPLAGTTWIPGGGA